MKKKTSPGVISISSHVMRGTVGNRAIGFALTALGYNVWNVPTVVLPWHPGQGPSTRLTFDEEQFAAAMRDLEHAPWREEIIAVITGYFASPGQVNAAAGLVESLRVQKPDLIFLCDPVIGDKGGLYVAEDIAVAIRDQLLPMASVATPNRFELGWLAGRSTDDNQEILDAVARLRLPEAVVTSAHAMMTKSIANLYAGEGKAVLGEHRELAGVPNGLGDLLSALFLDHRLSGEKPEAALEKAVASVFEVATRAVQNGSDELMLETDQTSLHTPLANIQMRSLLPSVPRAVKAERL